MRRVHAAAAALVAVPLLLAGCTDDASQAAPVSGGSLPASSASASADVFAPTLVTPEDLADTTVSIGLGGALVIAVPDGTDAEWSGTTDDPTIAEFSAGGASEGAVFHPGFVARGMGTTAATLIGPDGTLTAFEISVTTR